MNDRYMQTARLALGTVQFGCEYGINNQSGKIAEAEVFRILDYALENGLSMLDTAFDYGDSERIIGKYIQTSSRKFDIISKINSGREIEPFIHKSLERLNIPRLHGCLLHSFSIYRNEPEAYDTLLQCKERGLIAKTGFSLYHPHELETLWQDNIDFDIVQVPYSIFDQRFAEYFDLLKAKNVEIHVRSVFLQGLYFKESTGLHNNFAAASENLHRLEMLSHQLNVPLASLCLNFVLLNPCIDKVLIGVDSHDHLVENINVTAEGEKIKEVYQALQALKIDDEKVILPYKWPQDKG